MVQNELLADIMLSQPDLVLGTEKIAGLQKVLGVYGEVVSNKKLQTEAVASKIKQHVSKLKEDQFFI